MTNVACSYCGRKGILIYPVRYAVACPNGQDEVPGLLGNFKIQGAPVDVAPAKYVLRALRTGYLYTYEEQRKRLKSYIVLPNGALWEFPVEYIPTADPDRMSFCCVDRISIALSYCIDIEPTTSQIAGNIWFGWSNVLWTKSTLENISDANWRRKHMQCVDSQAMIAGTAPHSAKFSEKATDIPHFNKENRALEKAFDFSNMPSSREVELLGKFDDIKSVLEERCPYGGFIVALNDPVGIVNDLSELTCPTHHAGFDENVYRGQICAQLIHSVEKAVRSEAKTSTEGKILLERAAEINPEVAQGSAMWEIWRIIKAGGLSRYTEQNKVDAKKYGETKEGRILAAQDRAWKELTTNEEGKPILDLKSLMSLPEQYLQAIRKYEPVGLKLAELHSAWLTSIQLSDWMEGTHDQADIRSGYAFRESLAQCIGKAIATERCQRTLENWMSTGKLSDTKNLYARALLFNYKEIVDAAEMEIRGSDFKPKYLLSIYKGALGRLGKAGSERLVDSLTLTTANVLARALGQGSNRIMRNLVIASLTLQARVFVKPSSLTKNDLAKWIISAARVHGVEMDHNRSITRSSARKEAKRALPRYPAAPVVCAFELDIKSLEEKRLIQPGSLKVIGIPGHALTKQWLGSSSDFNVGVVGVILQISALYFANEDRKRGDEFDMFKLNSKVATATVSLCATIAETVYSTLEKCDKHPLSKSIFDHWALSGKAIKRHLRYAKGLGAIAGVINAGFDMASGVDAYAEGDWWLGTAYVASSVLSGSLAIAGFLLGSAIFWPLFAVTLVLGILVGILRPEPLKTWIKRCYFSVPSSLGELKKYTSLDEELKAFNGAAQG